MRHFVRSARELVALGIAFACLAALPARSFAQDCPTVIGEDGSPGALTGIINTYYPGTASAAAGATTISIGTSTGSSTAATAGDLLLVIQMQDGTIDSTNSLLYGDGLLGPNVGAGVTALNNTGLYEYVRLVSITSSQMTIRGRGTNNGLVNGYSRATGTPRRTFQVVRVPEYLNVTLGSGLTALRWNGSTGGVLVIDVADSLFLNGATVSVDGLGFRGGGGRRLTGQNGLSSTDYRTTASTTANGSKGEGIAGTPRYIYDASTNAVVDNTDEGYPSGSYARGAPGNAGGGGTDGNPSSNSNNSGGGGGGNCGAGGQGGNSYSNQITDGGIGGADVTNSSTRVFMGGGGGAGSTNDGSQDDGQDHQPPDGTGIFSSGGAGGGIIMARAGRVIGSGTFSANGAAAPFSSGRDGGGAGGAGGSIYLATRTGSPAGLTASATGGRGGNAWPSRSPSGTPGERHGPGGGGGGGSVFTSGSIGSTVVTGGANGTTTTAADSFGAASGSAGCSSTAYTISVVPGIPSGAECRNVTAVELRTLEATKYDSGVLIQWRTGRERDNLGFRIYRGDDGRRVQVTPELVAGSALSVNLPLASGYSYAWWDRGGTNRSIYWLEDVDSTGTGVMYGPIAAVPGLGVAPVAKQSAMLHEEIATSEIGGSRPVWDSSVYQSAPDLSPRARANGKPGKPGGGNGGGSQGANPAAVQWQLAGQSSVKLSVRETGWYRVTQPELAALGLDPARIDPRAIRLFADGVEVAIRVAGEEDGRFDATDSVEFFGTGVDVPTTDTRVYWLSTAPGVGKRIKLGTAADQRGVATSFQATVELEERLVYFAKAANGAKENWFGRVVAGAPVEQTLVLPHLDPSVSGGRLEVSLQGVTLVPHDVAVAVNGQPVGAMTYANVEGRTATFSIPDGVLHEGANVVTLSRQGEPTDVSLVDSLRITYTHTSTADGNELVLTTSGRRGTQTIAGFGDPRVRIVDVTDPTTVAEYAGTIGSDGSGTTITFPVAPSQRRLYAFAEPRVKRPAAVELNTPSTWNGATNAASVVMITHRAFAAELGPLVALRRSQGYTVAVVDVEDLYDEFSFGYHSPAAIRAFVTRAKASWRTPPRFVVLVGDASNDPRNYLGGGPGDYVPTKSVETASLDAASDDWLADTNGDDRPDVAIGRLPVGTVDEAREVVAKIVAYDQTSAPNRTALLVADADEDGAGFETFSQQVQALLPTGTAVEQVFCAQIGDAAARERVLAALNAGAGIVNYAGHGSVDLWRGDVLTASDTQGLANAGRLSVVTVSTCLNGYFDDPLLACLGEALVKAPGGGAVAVVGSTAITTPTEQEQLSVSFYRELLSSPGVTLGEALVRAKASAPSGDARRTLVLLGDPVTRLR